MTFHFPAIGGLNWFDLSVKACFLIYLSIKTHCSFTSAVVKLPFPNKRAFIVIHFFLSNQALLLNCKQFFGFLMFFYVHFKIAALVPAGYILSFSRNSSPKNEKQFICTFPSMQVIQ